MVTDSIQLNSLEVSDQAVEKIQLERLLRTKDFVINEFFGGISKLDSRHNMRVTSEALPMSSEETANMQVLAELMPGILDGLGKLIALSTIDDRTRRIGDVFKTIRRVMDIESDFGRILQDPTRSPERKLMERDVEGEEKALGAVIADKHPITRIDLMKDPISGNFMIAEIEIDKLHGLGYTALCRELSETPIGSGLVEHVLALTEGRPTGILLSASERFYIPEETFFAKRVNEAGGNLKVIFEDSIRLKDTDETLHGVEQLMTLPKLNGELRRMNGVEEKLQSLIQSGRLRVLSTDTPGLQNKGSLALLSNPTRRPDIEEILEACFGRETLDGFRQFLPETFSMAVLNKQEKELLVEEIKSNSQGFFVKIIDSSGARGIGKPGDLEKQLELLSMKKGVIVQRAVVPFFVELPFMNLRNGSTGSDVFSLRFGLFTNRGTIQDVAVTASPSITAHGGVTSIQMGTNVQI